MFDFLDDFRVSLRALYRRPTYPLVAVGILALGLSACMAVVTYVHAFFQPFPGIDADGLVGIYGREGEEPYGTLSYLDFLDYAESSEVFARVAAVQPFYMATVRLETQTEVTRLEAVSGDYFSVLGVPTVIGRGLGPKDDRPEANPAAVISHGWWQRSFGGNVSVLGSTIHLNYRPYTVVGVAAPEFLGSTSGFRPEVWIPIAPFRDRYASWSTRAENRDAPLVRVYGRLAEGATADQALEALQATAAGLDEAYPRRQGNRDLRVEPATWIDPTSRVEEWSTVKMMSVAVLGLLLLVCANVANLLLASALQRRREAAVRAALGASPWRLVRQVLLQNLLLAGAAGVVAVVLAEPLSLRLGEYFARPSVWGVDVARQTAIDARILGIGLLVSVLTGLVSGLLPALQAWRKDLSATLRTAGISKSDAGRLWGLRVPGPRDLLVSAQVALAVVLLVVAGLVVRTLVAAESLDPGFRYDSMVATLISTSSTDLEEAERPQFLQQLRAELEQEPWVDSVTVAARALLAPHPEIPVVPDGENEAVSTFGSFVSTGFFDNLGIPTLRGRVFADTDDGDAPDVAVLNQSAADRLFPGREALGRHVALDLGATAGAPDQTRRFEVVGVVQDAKTEDFMADAEPTVYFAYAQQAVFSTTAALMVQLNEDVVDGSLSGTVPRLHRWLRDYEPHLAIINGVTYRDVVRGFLYAHRMNAEMFSLVAFLGLLLSVVGMWSVVNLAVTHRAREIAVRMAVGAARADIGRLIVSRALISVGLGLIVGLALSYLLSEWVRSLLLGVEPTDPVTLAAGAGVLVVSTLAAALHPTQRAVEVDPCESLRQE